MSRVTLVPPAPIRPDVHVEMNMDEAIALRDLFDKCSTSQSVGYLATAWYRRLIQAGVREKA